ncbi:MAG TPA: pectate lyase [Longimicrobiales bacterium]
MAGNRRLASARRATSVLSLLLGLAVLLALVKPPITVHLAGDSTMAQKADNKRPETGWGEALQQYFAAEEVRVVNYAKNGRSTRTFISEGLWQQLIESVRAGDYVFIQFGHNDESPKKTDRYTPPPQYRDNLVRFVREVRAEHATPVLMTPVSRRKFNKDGTVNDSHRQYSAIVRSVADELHVAFIDMDRKSAALLASYGPEASRQLFLQLKAGENPNYPQGVADNTHFNPAGAAAMAGLAIDGIREQKLNLAKYLKSPAEHAQSAEWQQYRERSRRMHDADTAAVNAELRAAGKTAAVPAPTDQGFFLQDSMTAQWFAGAAAGRLADYIISYQAPNGGWSKRMAFDHVRVPGEAYVSEENRTWFSTIDNGATTEQLRFLGERLKAQDDARYRAAFLRGVDYLLAAQMPAGCWPQIFPLAGNYHDAITFNDDATINVLRVLQASARGDYGFVPQTVREQSAAAVQRGVACILNTQYVQNGRKTGWGAQHDPLTLLPTKARAYEHPSLSGREGAAIVNFLMQLPDPSPEVVAAVHAAAQWFKDVALRDYSYAYKGDLTPKPGAGPIWARFYELGTNRPIFSGRDGVIRYSLNEIEPERRYGYGWYTDEPATTLRRYEKWAAKHPLVIK